MSPGTNSTIVEADANNRLNKIHVSCQQLSFILISEADLLQFPTVLSIFAMPFTHTPSTSKYFINPNPACSKYVSPTGKCGHGYLGWFEFPSNSAAFFQVNKTKVSLTCNLSTVMILKSKGFLFLLQLPELILCLLCATLENLQFTHNLCTWLHYQAPRPSNAQHLTNISLNIFPPQFCTYYALIISSNQNVHVKVKNT